MARFTLYLEEDSQSGALAEALTRAGLNVLRSFVVGMNGRSDREQLEFAAANGYVLYTANWKDFSRLHAEFLAAGQTHSGMLVHHGRKYSVGEQARRVARIWENVSAEEMRNRTESLSGWGD